MKILCVTKCPTGMVQTYVAAEKLEQAGKKLGIDLSVETPVSYTHLRAHETRAHLVGSEMCIRDRSYGNSKSVFP